MRPFTEVTAPQRSSEWFSARVGRFTASAAKAMLATVKSGEAAARRDLRMRLVCERLTGRTVEDDYQNADMKRGVELEPLARVAYESHTGQMVRECGFLAHNELPIGCSPDAVIGDFDGGVELKAPRPANHYTYLRAGGVPADYVPQLLHSLWVTGAPYWDFVSYCEAFPPDLSLYIVRMTRDEKQIAAYAEKAKAFLAEVALEVEAARGLSALKAAV